MLEYRVSSHDQRAHTRESRLNLQHQFCGDFAAVLHVQLFQFVAAFQQIQQTFVTHIAIGHEQLRQFLAVLAQEGQRSISNLVATLNGQ